MKKLYEEASVKAIAEAIRGKTGGTELYKIGDMAAAVEGITGVERVQWHQCPEAVRNYLNNVTYDPSDYAVSHIKEYAPAAAAVSNYKPIGTTIDGETFFNQVPNVETPFATAHKAGTVKPLDPLRWIRTSTWNIRDNGGWACDGGTVKYGLLFRGGYVAGSDRAVMVGELGIKHELDLRGKTESALTASPLGDDVYFTCADEYNWYTLTNKDAWRINLRCVFDAVTHGQPLYYHCAAGADRTGTLACILEGLLGVSQSDIDKDFELTSFYSGTDTDSNTRCRNQAEWKGLINAINAKAGTTFRDKCVTFAAELGFTADEINAYRAAMIDGNPETVTPNISTYDVKNQLNGTVSDNAQLSATQYQSYEANISAQDGKVIESVIITMGGIDITASAWRGVEANLYRKVALNLSGCVIDNERKNVIDGQSYAANVSADVGYTLDGATATITMGGIDMSNYYSGGKIVIPAVTGDIQITIDAAESAVIAPNILTDSFKAGGKTYAAIGFEDNVRLSTATGITKAQAGVMTTGFIPIESGMILRIKPSFTVPSSADGSYAVCVYNAEKEFITAAYLSNYLTESEWGTITHDGNVTKLTHTQNVGAYVRFCWKGVGASTYITYDAAMPE